MSAKMPESGQEEDGAEKKDEVQKAQEERRVRLKVLAGYLEADGVR